MRRCIDIAVASLALLVSSPLLLLLAIAVVVDSPGGPFHSGWRCGRDGAPFRIWKFRTMIPGADALGPAITGANDPRVTRLGRFLRRSKLDELPQFFNVLLGDMTLVGPRPEAPEIVALYTPEQRAVLRAKPGLTGCGQVEVGHEEDCIPAGEAGQDFYIRHLMPQKVARDLAYLDSRTAAGDARVVLSTAALVFRAFLFR